MGDASELETKMREIDEKIRKCQKELDELNKLEPSDMGKTSPKQHEISQLMEKRDQLQKCWEKTLTGQSPEQ